MNTEDISFEYKFRDSNENFTGAIDTFLTLFDKEAILLLKKVFTSERSLALTVLKTESGFKVVRSRKSYYFKRVSDDKLSDAMSSYENYLDFLFMVGMDEVYSSDFDLDTIQLMIESLVSYFDVGITQNSGECVVHIVDNDTSNGTFITAGTHALYFRPEDIRTSFNAEFLKHVQSQMKREALPENSKNKVGIEHVAMSLKKNLRPNMKVLEYDPFITDSKDKSGF